MKRCVRAAVCARRFVRLRPSRQRASLHRDNWQVGVPRTVVALAFVRLEARRSRILIEGREAHVCWLL